MALTQSKTLSIVSGVRDADNSAWSSSRSTLLVEQDEHTAYLQFQPRIPQSASIVSALLTLVPATTLGAVPWPLTVGRLPLFDGDLATDRSGLTEDQQLETVLDTWVTDAAESVDIAALVTGWLGRDGYDRADWLTLKLSEDYAGFTLAAHAYDGDPAKAATLALSYTLSRKVAAFEALRRLIAACATFQSVTGAADAEAAEAFVHTYATPHSFTLPAALIHDLADVELVSSGIGFDGTSGRATISLLAEAPAAAIADDGTVADYVSFLGVSDDWHHRVAEEIKLLGRSPGYLNIIRVAQEGVIEVDDQLRRVEAEAGAADKVPVRTDLVLDYGLEESAA